MAISTADQLFHSSGLGRCELIRGELAVMNPPGGQHGQIAMLLAHAVFEFVGDRALGEVLAAETGFVISRNPDTVRAPDVAFVRSGREIGIGFVEGAPDLAVEVLSPSDRPGYVREKVAEWLEAGAQAVWVVDPSERTVAVHVADRVSSVLTVGDTLHGGDVLPGFALALSRLF